MNISDTWPLFAIVSIVVLASLTFPPRIASRVVFPFANLALLAWVMPDPKGLAVLCAFVGLCYGLARLTAWRPGLPLTPVVAAVVFIYAYCKAYPLISLLPYSQSVPVIVGLAYIVIRCLQVIIDCHQQSLGIQLTLWRFVNFLLAWPTLLSGPIMTYREFCRQWDRVSQEKVGSEDRYSGFSRAVWGLVSVMVISDVFNQIHVTYREQLFLLLNVEFGNAITLMQSHLSLSVGGLSQLLFGTKTAPVATQYSSIDLAVCTVSYLFYLYFNFAGYTSIVIGFGRMCGWSLPENFNQPWASRNALDLWSRWHMSLANWFRTYVFNMLMKYFLQRWTSADLAPYFAAAAFFVTFFLVGIWHGPTTNFILCGLALGASVSVNKLWQTKCTQWFGKKKYGVISSNEVYRVASSGLAITIFAFSIIPFWTGVDDMARIFSAYGLTGLLQTSIVAFFFYAATSYLAMAVEKPIERLRGRTFSPYVPGLGLGLVFAYCVLFSHRASVDFIYQRF